MNDRDIYICLICHGNGLVSAGFYTHGGDVLSWATTGTDLETCRSCMGRGWVTVPEEADDDA